MTTKRVTNTHHQAPKASAAALKLSLTILIVLALLAAVRMNASILTSSLSATPTPYLKPPPPTHKVSQDRHLINNDISLDSNLPIYTKEMAAQAIRPAPWTCGNPKDSAVDTLTHQKPMFSFVHIYKTAGSTIRTFMHAYAHTCRKAWMCLIGCTAVSSSSIQSDLTNWKPCRVKNVVDRHRRMEGDGMRGRVYVSANNTILRDNIDIFGGHFRIGAGDYILKKNDENIHPMRYIIFMRDSMERFVSGILYERRDVEDDTLESIVELIKTRVWGSRNADDYWGKSLHYLLTPGQDEEFKGRKKEFLNVKSSVGSPNEHFAEMKARTAINNLFKYNVIVGMSNQMDQSMEILKHILLNGAPPSIEARLEEITSNRSKNESKRGQISTSSVLEELKKDSEFMLIFEEYLKFEKMINDFALNMHLMQYEQVAMRSAL